MQIGGKRERQCSPFCLFFRDSVVVQRRGYICRSGLRGTEAYCQSHAQHRANARAPKMRNKALHQPVGYAAFQNGKAKKEAEEYVKGEPELAEQQSLPVHLTTQQQYRQIFLSRFEGLITSLHLFIGQPRSVYSRQLTPGAGFLHHGAKLSFEDAGLV